MIIRKQKLKFKDRKGFPEAHQSEIKTTTENWWW